jgi:hypothetical protein
MGGTEGKAYMLGCIGSIFAPLGAIIEWSYRWLDVRYYFLRMLVCLPISVPFIMVTWLVTSIVCIAFVSMFKHHQPWPVSLIVGLTPWVVCLLTCCDHLVEIPFHYAWFLIATAIFYTIDCFRAKNGYPKDLQRY